MTTAVFSSSWYRVASLKPRLRSQASLTRHTYRGERWHVLQDLSSGRFLRFDATAWRVLSLMDGQRTLDEIWHEACALLGDAAPTQDEVLGLLSQLHQSNVLLTDKKPDLEELSERHTERRRARLKQYFANPLSLRLPLVDPDRFLTRLVALLPRGLWRVLPWAWLLLVGSAVVQAGMHFDELTSDITARIFTAENMLMLWLVFPLLKAIHELGHGIAIKALGGRCHEFGLMFLIMVPVPYAEASQANAMPNKWHRMLVGAAGMMSELAVAAVAMWLWTWTSPGLGRAALHEIILVAGFTTLVFNGNPLLRFDGYYILADWLEIPNLAQKANRYLFHLVRLHVFKMRHDQPPRLTPRERGWLLGYAIASFLYRTSVTLAIVLVVATRFFFIGVLLALWSAWGMVVSPLVKYLKFVGQDAAISEVRPRVMAVTAAVVAAVLGLLLFVPAPSFTMTEGVIWMPEQSRVRAPISCFGAQVAVAPGTEVKAGQVLLTCTEPELDAQVGAARAELAEQEARLALAQTVDRSQAQAQAFELEHRRQRLAQLEQRLGELRIISPHSGSFMMSNPADYPGRHFTRGDLIAYVLDPARYTLLAVVPQGDVDLVRNRTERVELRAVDRIRDLVPARIVREVPAASTELPSMALALQGGGKIGLDPNASNASAGPRALTPLFQFELDFKGGQNVPRALGSRVYVRFVHPDEPLAVQWMRSIRQQFLKRFAV